MTNSDTLVRAEPEDWHYSCSLTADPRSASRARAFVCRYLVEHRLLHLVDTVRLVASELATNAVVHASTPFTISLQRSRRAVVLQLTDGSATSPTRRPVSAGLATGGYGLGILDALSLDWGVVRNRADRTKTVWASFDALPHRSSLLDTASREESSVGSPG